MWWFVIGMKSMLHSLLLAVVLFISPAGAAPARGGDASAAATQPAQAPPAPPAEAALPADTDTLYGAFRNTRMGALVEGKKRVTLEDVRDPLFWIDTLKDLALAVLGFIPRLIVAGLFLIF